jgi:hypothetical protein
MHIQTGIPEYVSRVRGAPGARSQRTTPVHGRGMRAASGQEDAWDGVAAAPFTAITTANRVSLQRPAVWDVRPGKFALTCSFAAKAAKLA